MLLTEDGQALLSEAGEPITAEASEDRPRSETSAMSGQSGRSGGGSLEK